MPKTTEQVEGGGSKVHRWPPVKLGHREVMRLTAWDGHPAAVEEETYVPVSALLSDEVVEAAAVAWDQGYAEKMARFMQSARPGEAAQPFENSDIARAALTAAVDHLGGTDAH